MSSMIGATGATPSVSRVAGTGYNQVNIPKQNPTLQMMQQLFSGGAGRGIGGGMDFLSKLAQGGDESMWQQLEAPAMRQFGELQGNIASRFSGMGTGGRKSSGFQNAVSGAGADLAERLQAQRMGLQQQALKDLWSMGQGLLGSDLSDSAFLPKKKKWWEDLLVGASTGFGQGLGMLPGMFA